MQKVGWWKKPFAWLFDHEWDLDPYKIAAFVLVWQFAVVVQKTMALIDVKTDAGLVAIAASLLVPITTMITFLFNFSKEHDANLQSASKE
jgi:hypothetical protein